jgi:competence protein ComEA
MDLTKREKIGISIFAFIILLAVSIMYFNNNSSKEVEVISKSVGEVEKNNMEGDKNNNQIEGKEDNNKKEENKTIKVCILGEIIRPGVYTLNEDDRIEQLVDMAGGFTSVAQKSMINLAKKLKDEDLIRIPNMKDKTQTQTQTQPLSGNGLEENITESNQSENSLININTATKEQLKELPRIGDAIAQRILDHREQVGAFKKIENIMDVSGIGAKMFENLKNKITID